MTYEAQIGNNWNIEQAKAVPSKKIPITQEQADILVAFADIIKDDELNTIYRINSCSFKIVPVL